MTSLSKLKKRGIIGTTEVYEVWFKNGQITGISFTESSGWQGSREGESIFLHNRVEVRTVETHCGLRVVSEDYPKIESAAKKQVLCQAASEAGYATNCGILEGLVRRLADLEATGQTIDQLDFSTSWSEISVERKLETIKAAQRV